MTVLASSGDGGATDATEDGSANYPYPVNSWPSADPLVTSIGGTQLHLDDAGNRTAPESVYNDYGAGGGGQSHVFARPVVPERRARASSAPAAAPRTSRCPRRSTAARGCTPATTRRPSAGTSTAAPARRARSSPGIVALADQVAGHRVGDIHTALYALSKGSGAFGGVVDVKDGTNNSYDGVTGYTAVKGYDMATGVGTVDAARFVPALALFSRLH